MATITKQSARTESPCAASPELQRKDAWWTDPLVFFLLFSAFGLWATFRAFQNDFYEVGHYLSPFYSPHIDLYKLTGFKLPNGWQISPALLILPFPLSFRLSCYYYRRSIYRAYLQDPAGCAVPEPSFWQKLRWRKYIGETAFPFIVQNFHRYAFYAAALFIFMLWYDAFKAFLFVRDGSTRLGIGVGTLVLLVNVCLLSAYTFSCHSWRHLIGGNMDCYSCSALARTKHGLWQKVSFLNEKHGKWAMFSLVSVGMTDVYIYLVATGRITDFHLTF